MQKTEAAAGFATCMGRGFHLTFPNGATVSVQFGPGNYCANQNTGDVIRFFELCAQEKQIPDARSPDAEIAIWDKNGVWLTRDWRPDLGDDVAGWLSPMDVLEALNWAAQAPCDED